MITIGSRRARDRPRPLAPAPSRAWISGHRDKPLQLLEPVEVEADYTVPPCAGARPRRATCDGKVQDLDRQRSAPDIVLEPDPVIESYKRDVDRTLLRENLRLTPQQRIEKLMAFMRSLERLREAASRRR